MFDLTPKGRGALSEFFPVQSGNLRVELKFKDALVGGHIQKAKDRDKNTKKERPNNFKRKDH